LTLQERAADVLRTRFSENSIFIADHFIGDRRLLFDQIGRMRRVPIGKNKQQVPALFLIYIHSFTRAPFTTSTARSTPKCSKTAKTIKPCHSLLQFMN